jgi:hypothetical protein
MQLALARWSIRSVRFHILIFVLISAVRGVGFFKSRQNPKLATTRLKAQGFFCTRHSATPGVP